METHDHAMADFLSDYKKWEIEWKIKLSFDFPLEYAKQRIAQEYDFLWCVQIDDIRILSIGLELAYNAG